MEAYLDIKRLTPFREFKRFDGGMGHVDCGILWRRVSIREYPMWYLYKGRLYFRINRDFKGM